MAIPETRKAEILALLKANSGNISKTAREAGIDRTTLQHWVKGEFVGSALDRLPAAEGALGDLFERIARTYITRALDRDVVKEVNGQACVTSAAIAIDKMRLLRGEEAQQQNTPTAIQFNLVQNILIQAGAIER